MELWLILGILSYISYAISNSIDKYLMNNRFHPLTTNTVKMFFDGAILLTVGLLFFDASFSTKMIIPGLVLGTLMAASGVLYFQLLRQNKVSEIIPSWQALIPLLTFIGAIIFLHETPDLYNYAGIILVSAGIYLILKKKRHTGKKVLVFIGIIAVIDAIHGLLVKYFVGNLSPIGVAISMYFATAAVLVFYAAIKNEHTQFFSIKNVRIIPASMFGSLGTLLLFFALSMGNLSKVYPLAGIQSVFVLLIASLFLKEKFTVQKIAGTIAIFAGIYLVSV